MILWIIIIRIIIASFEFISWINKKSWRPSSPPRWMCGRWFWAVIVDACCGWSWRIVDAEFAIGVTSSNRHAAAHAPAVGLASTGQLTYRTLPNNCRGLKRVPRQRACLHRHEHRRDNRYSVQKDGRDYRRLLPASTGNRKYIQGTGQAEEGMQGGTDLNTLDSIVITAHSMPVLLSDLFCVSDTNDRCVAHDQIHRTRRTEFTWRRRTQFSVSSILEYTRQILLSFKLVVVIFF